MKASPHKGLRRLWPDTLFGQLVLTFSLALLALLVLASLHLAATRLYYMLRWMMSDRSRQLANVTLLLDAAEVESRQKVLDRLYIQGLSLSLAEEPPELPAPDSGQRDQRQLEEARELLARILQRSMEQTPRRQADSPQEFSGFDNASKPKEYEGKEKNETMEWGDEQMSQPPPWEEATWSSPLSPKIRVTVLEINVPDPLTEIFAPVLRLIRPQPQRKRPDAYRSTGAVQLADGSWLVFEDSVPGYQPSSFPFTGIVMMEVFFVLISLLTFLLIVRPLRRLARAADSFGRDMPGTPPLPETGPREVREAAQAFNRMQQRIREFVDERARTLAAVSHDLRTPLTRLRLRVEQLDDDSRQRLQKDMDELQSLMDTTIDMARGSSEAYAPVDVAALLESLVEDRQDMGQNVVLEESAGLRDVRPIMARPLCVKRCLANLLDNAIRYGSQPPLCPPVEVSVEASNDSDTLVIIIRDHGPGIPAEHLQRVFEPFFRLEPSRNRGTGGNGLGLGTARSMARMHGGDITLSNAPDGGLVARLILPRHN